MKKKSMIFTFALFFVLGTFLFSTTASAYIDPSAMTFLTQVIVGIVIASGTAVGFFFKKMKRKLKKDGSKPSQKANQTTVETFDNDDEFDDSKLSADELNTMNGKKKI